MEHPERSPEAGQDYIAAMSGFFERVAGWSYDHRWLVAAACLLLVAASALSASHVRIDNSFEAYFDRDDPAYRPYLRFRDDFGSDEVSYILYEAPGRPHGVWNRDVARTIQQLTQALEDEVPFVKKVTSLANVEFLEPVAGGWRIYNPLEDFPVCPEATLGSLATNLAPASRIRLLNPDFLPL